MVAIARRTQAPNNATARNDISDSGLTTNDVNTNKKIAHSLMKWAVRNNVFYSSAGAPTSGTVAASGAICLDTTNQDVYVCVDRSTPSWTILAE